jgi:hypothetical protein
MKGECLSCFREAQDTSTDLRECGQCHWPMCTRCWDYYNGVCQRCDWTIPDLPPRLLPFLRRSKPPRAPDRPGRVGRPRTDAMPADAGAAPLAEEPHAGRQDRPVRPRRR